MANEENITPVTEDDIDNLMLTLETEDGTIETKVILIFELNEQDYVVLLPVDKNGNEMIDADVMIYKYFEDDDGLPSIDNITDEDEMDAVADRFDEILDEALYDSM